MSNANRERKLKPHQRRIWTDAFKASLSHVSIEAAERKAWQAVDICERVGAFHESVSVETQTETIDYATLWKTLYDWIDSVHDNLMAEQIDQLLNAMTDVEKMPSIDFMKCLRSISPGCYDSE
jgi:hypothetical protein